MRDWEIRGYSKEKQEWIFGTGWWCDKESRFYIIDAWGKSELVEENSIGRWTGSYATNGQKLFEDDYIIIERYNEFDGPFQVVFYNSKFTLCDSYHDGEVPVKLWSDPETSIWKIVGNTTETPSFDDYRTRPRRFEFFTEIAERDRKQNLKGEKNETH